jgi:1-deoxy-D-xylulose-5-phosphate synthase
MRVLREGDDVALVAVGKMVAVALQAADRLAGAGVRATVVDARFVKPVDTALAPLIAHHRAALTIEDGTVRGGFGSGVLELLASAEVQVPVRVLGLPDHFVEHGAQATLLSSLGLDAEGVAAAARALLHTGTESALAG